MYGFYGLDFLQVILMKYSVDISISVSINVVVLYIYMFSLDMSIHPPVLFQPLRVCVLGPPAVGKTTVVKQICDFYKLHHIKLKDVIDDAMESLVS